MSPLDPIARAYAIIGLRPGASAQQLKEQYKRLAKTWHPDRWANDPVSQAEAAQQMRLINDAYATLHRARKNEGPGRTAAASSGAAPATVPPPAPRATYRPLTEDELDAIVNAIGNESFVGTGARFLAWFVPMALAVVPIYRTRSSLPTTTREWTVSASLFAAGLLILIFQKLIKRQRDH